MAAACGESMRHGERRAAIAPLHVDLSLDADQWRLSKALYRLATMRCLPGHDSLSLDLPAKPMFGGSLYC